MKTGVCYFFGMIILFSFYNCANGKKLQEEAPLPFEQAYYTTWTGEVKGAGSGLDLFIPTGSLRDAEVELDSVYFRGKRAELVTDPKAPGVYMARFKSGDIKGGKRDIIMHRDPKEEYGNQPPEIVEEFPFSLEPDEAVVTFRNNGKTSYFKIVGIEERDTREIEIKYPENIRH